MQHVSGHSIKYELRIRVGSQSEVVAARPRPVEQGPKPVAPTPGGTPGIPYAARPSA